MVSYQWLSKEDGCKGVITMCGIVGYFGTEPEKFKSLFESALFNVYRGDDGIGVLYKKGKNINVRKILKSMKDIYEMKLEEGSVKKIVENGSFITHVEDEEAYEQKQKEWVKDCRNLMNLKSELILLHHRKATYGGHTEDNLHPFEVNNNFYIHNGTAKIDGIRGWMSLNTDYEFTSETDSEVLALIYNKLKEKYDNSEEIHKALKTIFPEGWGILIEVTSNGKITVVKDSARNLWLYKLDNGGCVFISEPTPYIRKYKKLFKLKNGVYKLNKNTTGEDWTDESRITRANWVEGMQDNHMRELVHCDICKKKKCNGISSFHLDTDYTERKDLCMECAITNPPGKGFDNQDDEDSEEENIIELYKSMLVA